MEVSNDPVARLFRSLNDSPKKVMGNYRKGEALQGGSVFENFRD